MGTKVLVTGGTKGIGYATAKLFHDEGYEVIVVARDCSTFDIPGTRTIEFDLEKIQEIDRLAEEVGDIDILVNNAGIDRPFFYDNYPYDEVDKILNINLKAPVELITKFAPVLIKNKGRVVNVGSQSCQIGHKDIWYGITKAGLDNATKSFASILGDQGVVINAVAPGPVDTGFIEGSIYRDRFEKLKDRTIIKRYAYPVEVAETILWLATKSPEYINGETININNGAQRIKQD